MRKTLIAIVLGLTALSAAACGNSGTSPSVGTSVSAAPLESVGASPSEMASPSPSAS
jgi:hypothetical protein